MLQAFVMNWKTSAAGASTILLFLAQRYGFDIPGVPVIDGQTLLLALGLLFARDQAVKEKN